MARRTSATRRACAHDVREGWITRTRADAVYGVILTDDGAFAEAETTALRVKSKRGRG